MLCFVVLARFHPRLPASSVEGQSSLRCSLACPEPRRVSSCNTRAKRILFPIIGLATLLQKRGDGTKSAHSHFGSPASLWAGTRRACSDLPPHCRALVELSRGSWGSRLQPRHCHCRHKQLPQCSASATVHHRVRRRFPLSPLELFGIPRRLRDESAVTKKGRGTVDRRPLPVISTPPYFRRLV